MKRLLFISVYLFSAIALFAQKTEISTSQIVDLGLSVKWAGWNVGATSPEKYGKLYGWADPTGLKSSNNLNDYPSVNPPTDITGTSYDIARVKWGGDWRIPTKNEMDELVNKCKWTLVTYRKVKGFKVTGPNGNSIFMPLTGSDPKTVSPGGFGITGNYWTSQLDNRDKKKAYGLFFDSQHGPSSSLWTSYRYFGKSVRPVIGLSSVSEKESTQVSENKPGYIKFDFTTVLFEPFPEELKPHYTFTFTNLADTALVINRIITSVPWVKINKMTKIVEPGQKGSIEIIYDGTGRKPGEFAVSVLVFTNAHSDRTKLTVSGYMTPKGSDPVEYMKEVEKKNRELKKDLHFMLDSWMKDL